MAVGLQFFPATGHHQPRPATMRPPPRRRLPHPPPPLQIPTLETQGEGEGASTMVEGEGEGEMPSELEVLSHLPAKKLLSLKVDCKDWLQRPSFVRLQLSRCNRSSNIRLLLASWWFPDFTEYNNYCEKSTQQIAYPPQFSRCIKVLGTADGLIYLYGLADLADGKSFASGLFNPSTKECAVLELRPPLASPTQCYWFGCLGAGEYGLVVQLSPSRETWVYRRSSRSKRMNRICCTKFILDTGSWWCSQENGTFVQGVIYWPFASRSELRYVIVAYHLGEKKYTKISSPPAQSLITRLGLFVDGCSLCAIDRKGCSEFELLVLKKDVGWTKYANIGFNNQLDFAYLLPLGFLSNGDLIMYGAGGHFNTWLMTYSFNDKGATFLIKCRGGMDTVVLCADTLVSPSRC